jgi:hypothetical protein
VKFADSRPSWCMAADQVMKIDGSWGQSQNPDFLGTPPHRQNSPVPVGGNEVFTDGSGRWIKATDMYFLHSWDPNWDPGGNRVAYFWQDETDLDPILKARLPLLKFKP